MIYRTITWAFDFIANIISAGAKLNPKLAEHPVRREECGRCAIVQAFPSRGRKSDNS